MIQLSNILPPFSESVMGFQYDGEREKAEKEEDEEDLLSIFLESERLKLRMGAVLKPLSPPLILFPLLSFITTTGVA